MVNVVNRVGRVGFLWVSISLGFQPLDLSIRPGPQKEVASGTVPHEFPGCDRFGPASRVLLGPRLQEEHQAWKRFGQIG